MLLSTHLMSVRAEVHLLSAGAALLAIVSLFIACGPRPRPEAPWLKRDAGLSVPDAGVLMPSSLFEPATDPLALVEPGP